MMIRPLVYGDELWEALAQYAHECSWHAGKILTQQMRDNGFGRWERVFAAVEDGRIAGYCTLTERDCIPEVAYSPYIGFVFVGEIYRGKRLSERMIRTAMAYAKGLGFEKIYIVTDHVNLYEKYGFVKIDEKPAPWNPETMETIFVQAT